MKVIRKEGEVRDYYPKDAQRPQAADTWQSSRKGRPVGAKSDGR